MDVLRWAALEVDATGADVATLTGRIADAVGAALASADDRPVLVRVTLTGATALHGRLQGDTERLAAECRNAAIEVDGALFVESVRVRTRPVPVAEDDLLAPLRAAFAAGLDDPALVASLLEELASLRQRLPSSARAELDLPEDEAGLRSLAEEAWQIVADTMLAAETRMKLTRLDLLRYGHLSDVTLDFPEDAALHVVHGANEAGKSTALAAIADALFGFGHRTDFDFLHGGPQLRVGFALRARDGTVGTFVRRKGRRDTLRNAADQVVPEDTLQYFLGGASRELFERSFGLDGARLRQGGQELLRGGGDAGESLLAGAGLLNLRAAAASLDEEAKSLVGDGRGRRRLSEAVETWRQAQRESEERSVAPRAWQDTVTAHTSAMDELERVQQATRALTAENSRLQRVRRVAPLLSALDAARDDSPPSPTRRTSRQMPRTGCVKQSLLAAMPRVTPSSRLRTPSASPTSERRCRRIQQRWRHRTPSTRSRRVGLWLSRPPTTCRTCAPRSPRIAEKWQMRWRISACRNRPKRRARLCRAPACDAPCNA